MRSALALPSRARLAVLALLLAATGLAVEQSWPARAATGATFRAAADVEVNSAAPSTSYGADVKMAVCQACAITGAPTKRAYVAFQITGLTGPVSGASLRVRALTTSVPAFSVHTVPAS